MDRRAFMGSVMGGLVAVPLAVRAQKAPVPVIGFLGSASPAEFAPYVAGFRHGLNEAGYVDGGNVAIDFRWAEGHFDRLPALVADLVRGRVTVLFATGAGGGAQAAKVATSTIPIVFTTGRDPVDMGLVVSLGHPGGNLTGVNFFATELGEKRLELLHALVPKATDIAIIVNPSGITIESHVRKLQEAARVLGLQMRVLSAANEHDIDAAFATFAQRPPGALLVDSDIFFNARREQIVVLAARHAVPAIYDLRDFVAAGGLMSYGASLSEAYRLAGIYVGKILSGAKPAELPIVQSTKIELVLNARTAKTLGLAIPQSVLARADEVIQ
jgi:putative ABC transport system substrate-binding protein